MSDHPEAMLARRAAITSQIRAETGIDEAMIERLVRSFYARVRDDATLAPIFAAKIEHWGPHLQKMFAFGSSVALMSDRYHGQPMARHLPLPIDARHFRSMVGPVRPDGARCLSASRGGALHPAVSSHRREPRTLKFAGRDVAEGRAVFRRIPECRQSMNDKRNKAGAEGGAVAWMARRHLGEQR
jgi:hypothetical protein